MHPFCINTPLPCFLLFRNSPVQVLPSGKLAAPLPLGWLFFHCPQQAYPEESLYLPQPSATPFRKSPSQILPSVLMKRPWPQQLPRWNQPSRQSPLSNCREPLPWGCPSSSSPQKQAPSLSMQTLRPSSPFLEDWTREGSCWRRDLTPSDKLGCILRRLLVMATLDWTPTLLLKVESDSSRLKGEKGSSPAYYLPRPLEVGGDVWQHSCPIDLLLNDQFQFKVFASRLQAIISPSITHYHQMKQGRII